MYRPRMLFRACIVHIGHSLRRLEAAHWRWGLLFERARRLS